MVWNNDEPGFRLTYKSNASSGPHFDDDRVFRYSTVMLKPSSRSPAERTRSTAISRADRIASLLHNGSSTSSVKSTANTSCLSANLWRWCGQCWMAVDARPISLSLNVGRQFVELSRDSFRALTGGVRMTEITKSSIVASMNRWSFIVDPENTRDAWATIAFSSQTAFLMGLRFKRDQHTAHTHNS